MKIVQIIPGSGGAFYCQNCLRDLALVRALRQQGHDVLVVPLYLPLLSGEEAMATRPLFYSAIPLYLRDRLPGFDRWVPAAFRSMLDSLPVLRFAARMAGVTRADSLGDLTLSMLRGESGRQAVELERLVTWLRDDASFSPDVICLSNALLLGMARQIKAALHKPVVCWLQDEHAWANDMEPDQSARVWQTLRERAQDVDGFVAVSRHYANQMQAVLSVASSSMCVIHPGVSSVSPDLGKPHPRTVGFLSRLAASEGFGVFVDAFIELHRDTRFSDVRLKATGGPQNSLFIRGQLRKLRAAGLADRVEIDPLAFRDNRTGFLDSLTLLSVPAPQGEAFGIYLIEAMAAGVPVVQPPVGAYPEILAHANCGVLSADGSPASLARAWAELMNDPARLSDQAARGRQAVTSHFNLDRMAQEAVAYYATLRSRS